ncbi:MAG: ATP-binding cassette domain-containing protein, partial [Oscillospiraceae bacterium]
MLFSMKLILKATDSIALSVALFYFRPLAFFWESKRSFYYAINQYTGDIIMRGTNMCLSFGLDVIFEQAEFRIEKQDKVGIIGVNGAGKTTLFRVLLQEQSLDSGQISIDKARIGYLPQEIALNDSELTVWDYLLEGRPIQKSEEELDKIYEALTDERNDQAALLTRMSELQETLEYYDCYKAEGILLEIIESMGIDAELLEMPLNNLSGGQKSKIAFARVLYSKPEILLLDEPTNHLDASTRAFVSEYLKNYKG